MTMTMLTRPKPKLDTALDEDGRIEQTLQGICRDWVYEQKGQFVWGVNDCCQIARTYYTAITGEDRWQHLEYDTKMGAMKIITSYGDVIDMFSHQDFLGEPSYDRPSDAWFGDIVVCRVEDQLIVGITNHTGVLCNVDTGLSIVGLNAILVGWHISPKRPI